MSVVLYLLRRVVQDREPARLRQRPTAHGPRPTAHWRVVRRRELNGHPALAPARSQRRRGLVDGTRVDRVNQVWVTALQVATVPLIVRTAALRHRGSWTISIPSR